MVLVCSHALEKVCMQVNVGCLPLLPSTLFLEVGFYYSQFDSVG